MNSRQQVESRVQAWARGLYPVEAGAELLIRLGGIIHTSAPWLLDAAEDDGTGYARIDTAVLLQHSGVLSGGQRRAVQFAVSLIDGTPVDLGDAVSGVDRRTVSLMLAAVAHATGSHEHSDVVLEPGRLHSTPLPTLYPWPVDEKNPRQP